MHTLRRRTMTRLARGLTRRLSGWRVAVMVVALVAMPPFAMHAIAANYTWDASGDAPLDDGSGAWSSTGGTNWFDGTTYGAWGNTTSDVAFFGVGNGAAGTVTVSGSVTTNGLTFNDAGSGNYTLSGGTIGLGGTTPTITVNAAGTTTIGSLLTGAAGMMKSGTGTLSLTGMSSTAANNYSGTTTIGQGTLAIASAGTTAFSDGLTFGASAGATDLSGLDLSNGSAEFTALTVQTTSTSANSITIGAGRSLTSKGNVVIGGNALRSKLTIAGSGTWNVTASNGAFNVGNTTGGSIVGQAGTVVSLLDAGALEALDINLLTTGTTTGGAVRIGNLGGPGSGSGGAEFALAATTTIKANSLTLANSNDGGTNRLLFGTGAQTLHVNTFTVGTYIRDNNDVLFADPTQGTLALRSASGAGRTTVNVANSGVQMAGIRSSIDFSGHAADLLMGTVNIVNQTSNGAQSGNTTGSFSFDSGTFDATTVNVGRRSSTGSASGTMTGTLNIGGANNLANTFAIGTLDVAFLASVRGNIVGNVTIAGTTTSGTITTATLATTTATGGTTSGSMNITGGSTHVTNGITLVNRTGATPGVANGVLSITGGSLSVGGNITTAGSGGTIMSTVTLDGGSLDMGGFALGTAGQLIGSLNLNTGTLANVGGINNGAGLLKAAAGRLTLAGVNTYAGPTTVTGGTLALANVASLASSLITVGTAAASTSAYLDVSALSGGLTLASNQTINGKGTILGDMVVGGGATVSPGNSTGLLTETGAVTFAGSGRYTFEINNATGTAGSSSGWDLFDVGSLSVTATGLNPFSVDLVTLTSAQTPGLADNFDPNGTYYWLFLDAGSAITTWDATAFQINATGFQNPTSNLFTVVRGDESGVGGTDQQLYVAYIGVPEPGSLALAGIGMFAAGWTLYRRRRRLARGATARRT